MSSAAAPALARPLARSRSRTCSCSATALASAPQTARLLRRCLRPLWGVLPPPGRSLLGRRPR
eukprot:9069607-Alexandrium_andersonii.AAC.1